MLTELRNSKLLTSTEIWDTHSSEESLHRMEFIRYLREIPSDFLSLSNDANKKEIVREHLRSIYRKKPERWEVDIVLDRVINLALFVKGGGRDAVEDKVHQRKFKEENWEHAERCGLCGEKFKTIGDVSLDHIIPLSLGGPEKPHNWQLTCILCNAQKDQWWGIADLSRIETFRKVQFKYFNLTDQEVIDSLRSKSNPTRYWILERDLCKCSECHLTSSEEKLVIGYREPDFLRTIDNLATYCVGCAKKHKKNPHSK